MSNEYFVNASDLSLVAGTIREKADINEQLVFPNGFVLAIEGISAGAGLNFEVVWGMTRPISPAVNTIWVNTGVEVTKWSFSQTEPTDPVEGMVWFFVSHSQTAINAITENEIMLYPSKAYQYSNEGAWVSTPAFTYKDGGWHDWSTYLYYRGDQCEDISGGWETDITNEVTFYADRMYVDMVASYREHFVYAGKAIDFSGANVLTIVIDVETTSAFNFNITSSSYNGGKVVEHVISDTGKQTIELDVSNIDGSYFISFYKRTYGVNTSDPSTFVRFNLYELYLT